MGGHDVELRPGQTLLGRHDSCQIVLEDPLVSRRHALMVFDGQKVTIEDLGSVNGVLLNGRRIRVSEGLKNGDWVRIGNQKITVYMARGNQSRPGRNRIGAQTLARLPLKRAQLEEEESTIIRENEALETLTVVADKVLARGQGAEAERILRKSLQTVLTHTRSNDKVDIETQQTAALYAVRLAEATQKGEWVDYVIELYHAAGRVLPPTVIDRLYDAVRTVSPVKIDKLRAYVQHLQEHQAALGPSDKFVLRRIEGLERVLGL